MSEAEALDNRLGINAMVASQASFAVSDTLVKLATASLPPGEIMAIRGLFATALLLAALMATGAARHFGHVRQPIVLVRAMMEASISILFVLAIAHLPIGNFTAILLSTPLMITAFAVFAMSADIGWRRWLAIVIGFGGVVMVAKPAAGGFNAAAGLAIACAVLVALRDLVTRRVPAHVPSLVIAFATTFATFCVGAALMALQPFISPSAAQVGGLALAAAGVTLGNFFVILATRKADISVVAPFRYAVMPFALASGFLVWGDVPDLWAACGIALIVSSGLYAFYRERLRARAAAQGLKH